MKIPKKLCVVSYLIALSLLYTTGLFAQNPSNDLERIFKEGVVRVGVKSHAPPFTESKNGQITGFSVAIAQAIASYLEVELVIVPLNSSDRIPFLLDNKVDLVIATMTITRSREKEVDFSIPYFQDGQSLLCLKTSSVQSYQDLKDLKVAAVTGTTSLNNLPLVQPGATVVAYDTPTAALEALFNGDIDAFSSDMLMLMGLKLNHENGEQLEVRGNRFTVEPYGVGIRPNQSDLRDKVNDAIMAMWKSGTWKAMYEKSFGPQTPYYQENSFEVKVIN
jgi:polar amino acid transport system substrate-binding protein